MGKRGQPAASAGAQPSPSVVDDDWVPRAGIAPDRIESLLPQLALLHGKLHHAVGSIPRAFGVTKGAAALALRGHVFSRLFRARAARNNRARRQYYNKSSNIYPLHPIAPVMLKSNSDESNNAAALSLCYVETPEDELFLRGYLPLSLPSIFSPASRKNSHFLPLSGPL
ncbi:conserved hypothetical protein [Agrobacterium tumefaciens str. B6]|uniref:Uncharacterized protein n=1 Tax=Agrobacterium tumefaciens str. B6 TaxID=1183423 RepID=A0A822V972_AGRTU|nr:conserved hypothetical protein [Agrobacterium tumefaciens str. B6]